MLLNTGMKSGGQPLPTRVAGFSVRGWQKGEENGRVPIKEIGGLLGPVTRHEGGGLKNGHGTLGPGAFPFGFAPFVYGRWKTNPAGREFAGIALYPKSDPKGPQPENVPSIAIKSRHV